MISKKSGARSQESEFFIDEMPRIAARTFEDLIVWQKAHEFVLGTYRLTTSFPKQEVYGLSLQMRRAAVSIPANIAEGFKKRGKADSPIHEHCSRLY
jgi:hypothetical protein